MSTINKIQQDVHEGILNKNNTSIMKHIRNNQIPSEFRLSIYRNNVVQNLRRALEVTYPAIWKLVGRECADNLAYAFIRDEKNLPLSNCLDDWGKKFPEFLQNMKPIAHLVYLKDIAEIEWLKHLCYGAADYPAFDPVTLQIYLGAVDDSLEELQLKFNPSVFLFASQYSLKNIIDLIENPDQNDPIDLQLIPNYAVIARQNGQVVTHWVSEELFDFLKYIEKGFTLTQALEPILEKKPNFDLTAALHFLLIKNLVL